MATNLKIFQICPQCHGTGEIDSTTQTLETGDTEVEVEKTTCTDCNGEKYIEFGYMEGTKIVRKLNKILDHFGIEDEEE